MGNVALLLDKARARRSIASDNALGAQMGKSRQTISQWRSGVTHPTDDDVLRLCAMAGEDCAEWLVRVAADRATSAQVAKAWATLAKRLGAAASLAVVALLPYSEASATDLHRPVQDALREVARRCLMLTRRLFPCGHDPAPVLA